MRKGAKAMSENKCVRLLMGTVISNKMNKSIVVRVERRVRHPIYGKYVIRASKIHAHDENNVCQIGDTVRVQECRPISKHKAWKLVDVVSKVEFIG